MNDSDIFSPPGVTLRSFSDATAARTAVYDSALKAANNLQPVSNTKHTLQLTDVAYSDPGEFSLAEQKEALLSGKTLSRKMRGTWTLTDNVTGEVVDKRKQTVASIPYVTPRGTLIHNGTSYVVVAQQRLLPGAYTRRKANGELETHVNVLPGRGVSHRYFLDPKSKRFALRVHQAKLPLIPLLRAMNVSDKELRERWGGEIFKANATQDSPADLPKFYAKFLTPKERELPSNEQREKLVEKITNMPIDPYVSKKTLGKPYDRLSKEALLAITQKLMGVHKGEMDADDRDDLAFQRVVGLEDLIEERLRLDQGGLRRGLLHKASWRGNLQSMPTRALDKQVYAAILHSGLGQNLEEVNSAEILDKRTRISRMGEGGISSMDAVPDEARGVQPSQFGFNDPARTPESFRAGVDVYLPYVVKKGSDGKLYAPMRNVKTGKLEYKSSQDLADLAVAFPGELQKKTKRVFAMKNGRERPVLRDEIDYELPNFENAFSPLANMVPLKSAAKPHRMMMAARMLTQAVPLVNAEAPLVQAGNPNTGGSYDELLGEHMGAVRADSLSRVIAVQPDKIRLRDQHGVEKDVELYHHFPFNRKTRLHQVPLVKVDQIVEPGEILAKSNYTDKNGQAALGLNLRVGYLAHKGKNYEDAIVISESAAKKLTSEHTYQSKLDLTPKHQMSKSAFISSFPAKWPAKLLENYDEHGVVKPGTVLQEGEPIILAVEESDKAHNRVHRKGAKTMRDASTVWHHSTPGTVKDVHMSPRGATVAVNTTAPMQIGDKLSGRYGDKGVIAEIVPDAQMPHTADNNPLEVLINPTSVISRTNPAQIPELALAKLAQQRGRPFIAHDFQVDHDWSAYADKLLRKAGISLEETVIDPDTGRKIRDRDGNMPVVGPRFFMKLHHTSEGKGQSRSTGGYTADEMPAKGGEDASKRISLMATNALLSHGATQVLRDLRQVRGQQNDEFWLSFMQGHTPTAPEVPLVYKKFVDHLRGSGINVVSDGPQTHIMAMTDGDIDKLAGDRRITSSETVHLEKGLKPIPGGLFDPTATGGHNASQWSAIDLVEPMPSPVMEEPIRRVLGLTENRFRAILGGREHLERGDYRGTGPEAIKAGLESINLKQEIAKARIAIRGSRKGERDAAVRRLGYLKAAERLDLHPSNWMLNKAPVLPTRLRPISVMAGNNVPLVADANYLYKELIDANKLLGGLKESVDDVHDERLAVYDAFKAVTGLGDPLQRQLKEKGVKGLLKHVFGSSPKYGMVQRKLLSSTADLVGRAVITPDPELDMDSLGLPEEKAWKVYRPFVVRGLVRNQNMTLRTALQQEKDQTPAAKRALLDAMKTRPVIMTRSPVMHKFGVMAFWPRLTKDNTVHTSPLIVKGFGADFDGDDQLAYVIFRVVDTGLVQRIMTSGNVIQLSEGIMAARYREKVPYRTGDNVFLAHLSDFPRGEFQKTTAGKNGRIDWYDVPAGIEALAYDETTNKMTWRPVTCWSKHIDRRVVIVELVSGRQIITDDDPRAIYGIAAGGDCTCRRYRPADAVAERVLVPRAARLTTEELAGGCSSLAVGELRDSLLRTRAVSLGHSRKATRAAVVKSTFPLDEKFGYMLGCFVGDGWVPRGTSSNTDRKDVCLAGITSEIVEQFNVCLQSLFSCDPPTACRVKSEQSYGESARSTWTTVQLAVLLAEWCGHGADNKQLPAFVFTAAREFRSACFAGLLDTDGSISVSRAKKRPQLMANYSSNSIKLVQQMQLLAGTLGIRSRITASKTPAGRPTWLLSFSNIDIQTWGGEFMHHPGKLAKLASVRVEPTPAASRTELVPAPQELMQAMARGMKTPKDHAKWQSGLSGVYSAVTRARKRGYITRQTAKRVMSFVSEPARSEITAMPLFGAWSRLVEDADITWDMVTQQTESGIDETGYDLTVPGCETFMNVDGVILSNTVNYHVPVLEEARQEAIDLMMPSKNLLSAGDLHTPMHIAGQEYVSGLHDATSPPDKGKRQQPVRFLTKREAMAAFRSGEITVDTPVQIERPG